MAEWGFPLYQIEIQMIVKEYLSKERIIVPQFNNNVPGVEWVVSFMKRHNFTHRLVSNIKRKRAEVSASDIIKYFRNLERELENVPPENIWNYDESNLQDDPGRRKCVIRRGYKYPERVVNCSKVGFSVMFSGNAKGDMLPPYVVYKSVHLYEQWRKGGPKGARFNRSKSGWFDTAAFTDWFITIALPTLRRQEGPKVLIGDNLSSHISQTVISLCQENNIRFTCLPPNTTHLTQPLDVAYFRPTKVHWRKILEKWKFSEEGRSCPTIPKSRFPSLLKSLIRSLEDGNGQQNMVAGFRKCGIYPLNREKVLDRLPQERHESPLETGRVVDESLMKMLRELRGTSSNAVTSIKTSAGSAQKKLRLSIEPGKSVLVAAESDTDDRRDTTSSESEESDYDIPKLPIFPVPEEGSSRVRREKLPFFPLPADGCRHSSRVRQNVDRFY
jgi:hypothetical protein